MTLARRAGWIVWLAGLFLALSVLGLGMGRGQADEGRAPGAPRNVGVYWAGPESYGKLKELGAQLIVSNIGNDTRVRLFWAEHSGVKLILFNSAWIDDSVPGGRANTRLICKNIREFRGHPALWGYYVVDEPSKHVYPSGAKNPVAVSTMQAVNQAVKRCDPDRPTVAVFLPGGGFGTASNNFGPGIADYIMFDLYPKAPGNAWHPEWITQAPLPAAIDVVRARDPRAKLWMAVQAFGGCTSSGCFDAPTEAQLRQQIDLNFAAFAGRGVRLDGMFFFLWDHRFDDDYSRISDDMRGHREYWPHISYAASRLPAAPASPQVPRQAGRVVPMLPEAAVAAASNPQPRGTTADVCTAFTPRGAIEGKVTGIRRVAGGAIRVLVGGRSFRVDERTAVVEFSAGQGLLGPGYLQRGAYIKAYARDRKTLSSAPACKVLVKAVANLKFEVSAREDITSGGVLLTVKPYGDRRARPYRTVEVDGALPTILTFATPKGQPALRVGQYNLQPGSLVQLKLGYVGGRATNLRATELSVLPVNGGLFLVQGPAASTGGGTTGWSVESLATPQAPFRTVTLDANAAVYFSGKDASGRNVNVRLRRIAVQPMGLYTFLGAREGRSNHLRANVAYQVPQTFWGIVTETRNGGRTMMVMGPDLPDAHSTQFRMVLRNARVYRQLEHSRPALAPGSVRPYSTALFTGYFIGRNTFKVTQAVFYWVAPPAP